jgi:TonB dependent receptor
MLSTAGVAPEEQFFKDIPKFGGMNVSLAAPFSAPNGAGFFPNEDNFRNNGGWNVSADVNWFKGNHNLQFGYQYILTNRQQINNFEQFDFTNDITGDPEAPGVTGNSLASALLGFPASFSGQLQAQSALNLNATTWALYAQDQWKVRPKLTIDWGLRWDVDPLADVIGPRTSDAVNIFTQQYLIGLNAAPPLCSQSPNSDPCLPAPLSSIPGNNDIVFNGNRLQVPRSEYHQLGPRIGLAWQVAPNTVVRGGYGLYYDTLVARTQTAQNDLEQLAWPYTTGFSGSANAPNSAGVPAGAVGNPLVPLTSIEGSFPSPVPPPTPWTPSGWADDPSDWDPYAQEWNVEIQHQFGQNVMVSASYVGSKSGDLPYTGPQADAARHPSPAATPLSTIDTLRPMAIMEGAPLYYTQALGIGNYDALELQFQRRFANGLQSGVNFTWSKSLDESSGYYDVENNPGGPIVQNYFDPASNYGLSGYDVPFFLSWFTTYQLPFGAGNRWLASGPASWILGGWQTNFIMTARSGQVFTAGLNAGDIANLFGTDTAGVSSYERPDIIGNPFSGVQPGYLFNASAFAVPATGTFGTVGPDTMRSPAVFDMDFSLFKNFPIGRSETRYLQLRIESFNLFNDMNWGVPNTTVNATGAGFVDTLALNPREFQFALRFVF